MPAAPNLKWAATPGLREPRRQATRRTIPLGTDHPPELNGKASTEAPLPDKFEEDLCIQWKEQMRGMFKTGSKATLTKKGPTQGYQTETQRFCEPARPEPFSQKKLLGGVGRRTRVCGGVTCASALISFP